MAHYFVLDISYTADVDAVDAQMAAHREFLADGYARGVFLASGRKEPRTGGIVLARGTLDAVRAETERDPFVTAGVADYAITEFVPTMTCPELDADREQPAP